jgi:hypothetical protein
VASYVEESTSFFEKKEAKKLLLIRAIGVMPTTPQAEIPRSFLLLFFKKEVLAYTFIVTATGT